MGNGAGAAVPTPPENIPFSLSSVQYRSLKNFRSLKFMAPRAGAPFIFALLLFTLYINKGGCSGFDHFHPSISKGGGAIHLVLLLFSLYYKKVSLTGILDGKQTCCSSPYHVSVPCGALFETQPLICLIPLGAGATLNAANVTNITQVCVGAGSVGGAFSPLICIPAAPLLRQVPRGSKHWIISSRCTMTHAAVALHLDAAGGLREHHLHPHHCPGARHLRARAQ